MKIAFLSPGWPPESNANGIVHYVSRMKVALESLGHHVNILALRNNTTATGGTAHFVSRERVLAARLINGISRRIGGSDRVIVPEMEGLRSAISRLHRQGQIDILQVEETWGIARHLVGRVPVPVIVRLHGPWFLTGAANGADDASNAFQQRVAEEERGICIADGVTGPSRYVIQATRQYYGRDISFAEAIPNPILAAAQDSRWSADKSAPDTLLFIGRFDRIKGGDTVIRAFSSLIRRRKKLRLIFCGPDKGFIDEHGRNWSFQEYCSQIGLYGDELRQVEYMGQQPSDKLAALRRHAAVTVVASRLETFSNTTLEAAALGCPVVATRCGGPEEIIRDEETGLLVPANAPEAMADAVERVLRDRKLASRLGKHAWEDVAQRFSPEEVAERTTAYYRQAISRWRERSGG